MTENSNISIGKNNPIQGAYASVNGLNLYYETYGPAGTGTPLVLLHGGLGSTSMYTQLFPSLSQNRQVIAVDLQAHGHTADIDRPFRFESMADDVAMLLDSLGISQADFCGYSLGGGVSLQMAIRHPDRVHKLVLISTPCKREGWYPENLAGIAAMNAEVAQMMVGSTVHAAYASAAPRSQDWPVLVSKTGELLRQEYDWCEAFAAIPASTLTVFADADAVRPAHILEMFQLRGGGQRDAGWDGSGMSRARLAILPGMTHYNIFSSPLLVPILLQFLGEPA